MTEKVKKKIDLYNYWICHFRPNKQTSKCTKLSTEFSTNKLFTKSNHKNNNI